MAAPSTGPDGGQGTSSEAAGDATTGAPGAAPIRVYLADDHPVFTDTLRTLLEDAGLQVVGVATDGQTARREIVRLAPDVAIVDVDMPGLSGIEVVRAVQHSVIAVVLSGSDDPQTAAAARDAGAAGFLLKTADLEAIAEAVRTASQGGSVGFGRAR